MRLDPSYAAPALARALAQIERGTRGGYAPSAISPPVEQYRAPVYCPAPSFSARRRARNLRVLTDRVAAWLDYASGMSPSDAETYLMVRAETLNTMIGQLACGSTPEALKGLDVFDLTEARERLSTASTGR